VLLSPLPFSVKTYVPEDLFAGKMHALLFREYKVRVKGRDWYDLVWYVARKTPLHLSHLEARMRQSDHWKGKESLTSAFLLERLQNKIAHLNIQAATADILPFVRDQRTIEIWSNDFFLSLLPRIQFV
jgi:hypothetical protein